MGSCIRIVTLGIVLSLVIGGVIGGRASAAPQILGLLATTAPTPLTCDRRGVFGAVQRLLLAATQKNADRGYRVPAGQGDGADSDLYRAGRGANGW